MSLRSLNGMHSRASASDEPAVLRVYPAFAANTPAGVVLGVVEQLGKRRVVEAYPDMPGSCAMDLWGW